MVTRLLAALGLAALAFVNVFGLVSAIRAWDWKGMGLMLFMAVLLVFFARTLWRGAKLERGAERGRLAEGWAGEPLTAFFTSVMARTTEGRIYIAGALASLVMAALALLWPEAIRVARPRSHGIAMLFALWPIVSFTMYLRICGPRYKTSVVSVLLTLVVVALPFYFTYA